MINIRIRTRVRVGVIVRLMLPKSAPNKNILPGHAKGGMAPYAR